MAGVFAWMGTTEGFAIWVRSRLVVDSDAAATAHNILAHELLHHLETIHGWTGALFIRAQHLGWRWHFHRLRVLSEIAALHFAELATGGQA